MASIRERTTRAGEHSWSVLFRHGSRQTSLTFETAKAAERFKGLVDLLGPDRAIESLRSDVPDDRLTVDELAMRFLEREDAGRHRKDDD